MTQQAANVIDFAAYRARRAQHWPLVPMFPYDLGQSGLLFAIPVLMPIVIAWLPIWSMATFSDGISDE
jgi:hypothetical protein